MSHFLFSGCPFCPQMSDNPADGDKGDKKTLSDSSDTKIDGLKPRL